MQKYVSYKLHWINNSGEQPYQAVADAGAEFNGGIYFNNIDEYYGTINGTEEQINQAISNCSGNFSMIELTGQKALDYFGSLKLKEISDAFIQTPSLGFTCSLGFKIDSTRDDLKNYQDLIFYMNTNSIAEISIRVNDGALRTTTLAELNTIVSDLIGYGLWLYQKKWDLETAVASATTVAEINAISW